MTRGSLSGRGVPGGFLAPRRIRRRGRAAVHPRRRGIRNLLAQLKGGVSALRAPLNTLESNWAYMVIASLAWSLKAWFALSLPAAPRWREMHEADRTRVLRMEFRSFVQRFILIPAQILRTGRTLVYRLIAWRPELPVFFRFLDAL
jgi:hypothetical protein